MELFPIRGIIKIMALHDRHWGLGVKLKVTILQTYNLPYTLLRYPNPRIYFVSKSLLIITFKGVIK